MRFRSIVILAALTAWPLSQALAVEAPEGPVSPAPQSPAAATATPYPQVATPEVPAAGPVTDSQAPLPPIQVPSPPSRDSVAAPAEASVAKSPGG